MWQKQVNIIREVQRAEGEDHSKCVTPCKVGSTIKYTIINAIVQGHIVGISHLFI